MQPAHVRNLLLLLIVVLAAVILAFFVHELHHAPVFTGASPWVSGLAIAGLLAVAYWLIQKVQGEADQAEVKSKAKASELFDITQDWYWEMGPDLRYTLVSKRFTERVGRVTSDFIGKTRFEMVPPEELDSDPDKWQAHRQTLENHQPFRDLEYASKNQSGEKVYIWVSGNPMFDNRGTFLGYRGMSKDVTKRVAAQEQVKENEARLRNILERAPIGIGITRVEDGAIHYANPTFAKQVGIPVEQLINHPASLLWKDQNLRKEFLKIFQEKGRVDAQEAEVNRRDGSSFWALVSWDKIHFNNEESVLFWSFEITDIKAAQNEIIEAKEKAEAANRAKSAFLASMSHELRTPLNAIIGFTGAIKSEVFGPLKNKKYAEYIKDINASGEHLLGLINDILDLSSIEADKISLDLETFYPKSVFRPCYDIVKGFAAETGVELIGVKKSKRQVIADKARLRQILLNLMSNAIKFNRAGGSVEFGCINEQDDFVRLFVKDSGLGIDKSEQHTLFEPFTRLHEGITPVSGTGIGLSISKKIVERMGGRIGVESVVGEGSTFWVDLPAVESNEPEED